MQWTLGKQAVFSVLFFLSLPPFPLLSFVLSSLLSWFFFDNSNEAYFHTVVLVITFLIFLSLFLICGFCRII